MSELKRILMNRDGLTSDEADERIAEMSAELMNGNENALFDEGLEDDYIFDLI